MHVNTQPGNTLKNPIVIQPAYITVLSVCSCPRGMAAKHTERCLITDSKFILLTSQDLLPWLKSTFTNSLGITGSSRHARPHGHIHEQSLKGHLCVLRCLHGPSNVVHVILCTIHAKQPAVTYPTKTTLEGPGGMALSKITSVIGSQVGAFKTQALIFF